MAVSHISKILGIEDGPPLENILEFVGEPYITEEVAKEFRQRTQSSGAWEKFFSVLRGDPELSIYLSENSPLSKAQQVNELAKRILQDVPDPSQQRKERNKFMDHRPYDRCFVEESIGGMKVVKTWESRANLYGPLAKALGLNPNYLEKIMVSSTKSFSCVLEDFVRQDPSRLSKLKIYARKERENSSKPREELCSDLLEYPRSLKSFLGRDQGVDLPPELLRMLCQPVPHLYPIRWSEVPREKRLAEMQLNPNFNPADPSAHNFEVQPPPDDPGIEPPPDPEVQPLEGGEPPNEPDAVVVPDPQVQPAQADPIEVRVGQVAPNPAAAPASLWQQAQAFFAALFERFVAWLQSVQDWLGGAGEAR